MIPAPAHGAPRELPGPDLGVTQGAEPLQVDQGPAVCVNAVDGKDPAGIPIYVDNVVRCTAVLVGVLRRTPLTCEGETAVPADEVPDVSHLRSLVTPSSY